MDRLFKVLEAGKKEATAMSYIFDAMLEEAKKEEHENIMYYESIESATNKECTLLAIRRLDEMKARLKSEVLEPFEEGYYSDEFSYRVEYRKIEKAIKALKEIIGGE